LAIAAGFSTSSLGQALRLLVGTSGLLAQPEHWTRDAWARDRKDKPVGVATRAAVSWCLTGAVLRVEAELFGTKVQHGPATAEWGLPSRVRGPKRLENALTVLGFWMAVVFRRIHHDQLAAEARAEAKTAKAKSAATHELVLDTRLVSVLNDQATVQHEHILLALDLAADDIRRELRERRRKNAQPTRDAR
jgi:hypothetical protein